jgi:hypothetical protein
VSKRKVRAVSAKVTHTPHGIKMAVVSDHQRTPGERGEIVGWTAGAARRNRDFLQSIDPARLNGLAMAYTFTVRDCPPDAEAWAALIDRLRKRLKRAGAIRDHWVVEWQKRGVPHLHGFAYFDTEDLRQSDGYARRQPWRDDPEWQEELQQYLGQRMAWRLRDMWLELAGAYRAGPKGQHAARVDGLTGWLAYLMKHASRGADHYQRQRHALPEGWQKSGRLWGKGGDWPTRSDSFVIDATSRFRLRRALRRYGRSQAVSQLRRGQAYGNAGQIASAKRALRYFARSGASSAETPAEKRKWSAIRGVNVMIPGRAGVELIEWAIDHDTSTVADGATVIDRSDR